MKKLLVASIPLLLLLGVFALPVEADHNLLARFDGGIGVIPQGAGANPNVVRGVSPAGQIWVIRELEAKVKQNGEIRVEGEGLVLGGGNSIGRATGQRVIATLICEATAPFVQRSTDPLGVPLSETGDFEIDDVVSPAPTTCDSPVLLIRNAANGGWFAAGILANQRGGGSGSN
jgi:hypothetical protein